MIEFKHNKGVSWETPTINDIKLIHHYPDQQFKNNVIRINGTIYTAYSQEFIDAFNLQCTWDGLTK